jgi:hypothetical protein
LVTSRQGTSVQKVVDADEFIRLVFNLAWLDFWCPIYPVILVYKYM